MPEKNTRYGIMYINMIRSTLAFALDASNIAVTNSLPSLSDGVQILKDNFNSIETLRTGAQKKITGYAEQKTNMRRRVAAVTYRITRSVRAYAINNKNEVLKHAMFFKKKELDKMKIEDFISKVQGAISQVRSVINNLGNYNLTSQMVNEWSESLQAYRNIVASPRLAITLRKTLNARAQTLLGESIHYLSNVLDPLAASLTNHGEYIRGWRNNRRLIPTGVQHTKIRISITGDAGIPTPKVEAFVIGTDIKAITNLKGKCTLMGVPLGLQSIVLKKGESTQVHGPCEIKKGGTLNLQFTMEGNGYIVPDYRPPLRHSKRVGDEDV